MFLRGDWIKLGGIFWLLLLTAVALFPHEYPATLQVSEPVGQNLTGRAEWKAKAKNSCAEKMNLTLFYFLPQESHNQAGSAALNEAEAEAEAEGDECSNNCKVCEYLPIKWVDTFWIHFILHNFQ